MIDPRRKLCLNVISGLGKKLIKTIGNLFKIILFFFDLFKEKSKVESEKKAKIGKSIVDAFKETNPYRRDSAIVSVIGDINELQ